MPNNLSHIMPNPRVVPILWGHSYVKYPAFTASLSKFFNDIVLGPYMNGLAQYGVSKATLHATIVIDEPNAPKKITYQNAAAPATDDITPRLVEWINAGTVPAPTSSTDNNTLYLILPPTETTVIYQSGSDLIGNGVQGWHNEGVTRPAAPPTYYWAIVKTDDVPAPPSLDFINGGIGQKVSHELVEQMADINGSWGEVGDHCTNDQYTYRGWTVQKYWSSWANACVAGEAGVSFKTFLRSTKFDFSKSVRSLGARNINLDYVASEMQSQSPPAAPPG